jgi:hypothetical protein
MKISAFLATTMVIAAQSNCLADGAKWGDGHKWGSGANVSTTTKNNRMEETKLLYNDDSLLPGQNRTQAMRLEAETGHINPEADSVLEPIIKRQHQQLPPPRIVLNKRAPKKLQKLQYVKTHR